MLFHCFSPAHYLSPQGALRKVLACLLPWLPDVALANNDASFPASAPMPLTWLWLSAIGSLCLFICLLIWQVSRQRLQRSQQLRHEAEQRFQQLANSCDQLIWFADRHARRYWFNHNWQQFHPSASHIDDWQQAIHPDDRAAVRQQLDQAYADRQPQCHEYRLRRHGSQYCLLKEQLQPRFDESGNFQGYAGFCRDISQEHSARETLIERERLLRVIFEHSNVGIALFAPEGLLQHANPHLAELFDCSIEALIGLSYFDLVHPDERSMAGAGTQKILSGELDVIQIERRYISQQQRAFWGRMNCRVMRDAKGSTTGIVVVIEDITARKRAEEKLRMAVQVFNNSHEAIMISDHKNRIVSVNPAFTSITGYSENEVIGKHIKLLASDRHDAEFHRKIREQIQQHGHWDGEIWNRDRHGRVHPEWMSVSVCRNEKGEIRHYITIFSDITERHQREQHIHHLAQYDFLTDLPNRALLLDRLQQELAKAQRHHKQFAVMFIDLDNFKPINDQYGHAVGDHLLCEVASRLKTHVRANDTVARQGGDEFIVLITDLEDTAQMYQLAEKLRDLVARPYRLQGHELLITLSIGMAIYPEHGTDIDTLINNADSAMYRVKANGRNGLECHDIDLHWPEQQTFKFMH